MKFGRGCGRGQTELDLRDPHAMPVTPERFPWLSKFDGQLIAGVRLTLGGVRIGSQQ